MRPQISMACVTAIEYLSTPIEARDYITAPLISWAHSNIGSNWNLSRFADLPLCTWSLDVYVDFKGRSDFAGSGDRFAAHNFTQRDYFYWCNVHETRFMTNCKDHSLPKSVVVRLAKSVLPENTMMQKEAVIALMKSATVFVNYLAATCLHQMPTLLTLG